MEANDSPPFTASHDQSLIYSDSCASDQSISESPPPPPPPPLPLQSRRLIVAHTRRGKLKREALSGNGATFREEYSDDDHESMDSDRPGRRADYDHQFCDSEESEPPKYHSLKVVPHMNRYPALSLKDSQAGLEVSTYSKSGARAASPIPYYPLPGKHVRPSGAFWRKQQEVSFSTDNDSYRSLIQDSLGSAFVEHEETTRREAVQMIAKRMSETYLQTLSNCGLPIVIKPRKVAIYTALALVVVNALAIALSWAALFSVDPSPTVITYSLTVVLGLSCVPCFFVFWAHKFNPFVAISAFSSTAFSGTFSSGCLQAFFVANNFESFDDTKMAAIGSAAAAFDIIAAILWLIVIVTALILYAADSEQRGHVTIQFVAFNTLAILVLVTFLLTFLADMTFFDKAGQINTMYLAVGFSLLSVLFSLCFCFCTGIAIKERESDERDECSRFIKILPFLLSAILTLWTFVCGILSMVIGTSLSHDEDYKEKYGGSVAILAYLIGTLNFGVSIATISVGCILGVHMFL